MNSIIKQNSYRLVPLLLLTLLAPLVGCDTFNSDEEVIVDPNLEPDITLDDGTKLTGLPINKSKSLFTSDSPSSSEQYIRNYLIKSYSQVIESYDYAIDSPMADTAEASVASGSKTTTSSTNTIENNVDEADLIKAFSENGQDYLVTITQPERTYFYANNEASVERYKQERTSAQLNLFTIDTLPSSTLIGSVSLNEDAYYVSGIYSYLSPLTSDLTNTQIIAQTSLWQSPDDWSNYQSWSFGRTGIESTQLNNDEFGEKWSMVFDGHMLDSRRIDNHMYVALRHYNSIDGLETAYNYGGNDNESENAEIIAKNLEIIEQLDIQAFLPNVSITNADTTSTSTVFDLESCHLPNNDERFSNGSVMFNYVAKIDLMSGNLVGVQCILSEINQLYMNEKSLFLIDANNWSDQTSRLHRFTLADLSYDTSLTIDGTLGWRSAQFRIKELIDGTVVAITSKPDVESENVNEPWCCWFNPNWIHKLQLFQKDENQDYKKIAELPNETQPDNDDTPQSLGKAGEDIYGVRIDENSVKIVTFQQTDPLYVFDITDRNNPAYTGEFADSGFSAYLHTFDDLIFGVGYDADEWGNREGLKVELYKSDSTSEDGIVSLKEYSFGTSASTPVEYDHHAFTSLAISTNETRIAIPTTVYDNYELAYTGLLLFTLDTEKESLSFDGTIKNTGTNRWSSWSDRSVIQHSEKGDVVHYIHRGEVTSKLWDTVE